jgi:hypothetical protein
VVVPQRHQTQLAAAVVRTVARRPGLWTAEQLAFTLREDDFLVTKLGLLKPQCESRRDQLPDEAARRRECEIAQNVHEGFPADASIAAEPLCGFVAQLSARRDATSHQHPVNDSCRTHTRTRWGSNPPAAL